MMDRRTVVKAAAAAMAFPGFAYAARTPRLDLAKTERRRVLTAANGYVGDAPMTISTVAAPRSPGTIHDYYSEADYWWPDPTNPGGSYVRRDGLSNPAKFDGHRNALIAFGIRMPALAAAWMITGERRFAMAAAGHLRAWFVDPASRMNPDLAHAQAIIGHDTGRAIGIIDTLQIVEVARASKALEQAKAPGFDAALREGVATWFRAYLTWLTTSPAGIEERDQRNNHGTCWLLQAAAFADLLGAAAMLSQLRDRLTEVLVPDQIATDGSQPLELARTKPYSYSLFNLDVLAGACQLLSTPERDLWQAVGSHGGSVADAIGFMAPFIRDKKRWPYSADVEHFDDLPVRQPCLVFGGAALAKPDWVDLWRTLEADPTDGEIIRNFPIRQPILWLRPGL